MNMEIGKTTKSGVQVSVVIPFLNENESLRELVNKIRDTLLPLQISHEILLIDDGSTDGGTETAEQLASSIEEVKFICFMRNFGKASALSAGFSRSVGDIVVTMDADLQDDPMEIPRFMEEISKGKDVVSGWKKKRHDPLDKTLPSKVFNRLANWLFKTEIHDINCGFKAYTREAVESLKLYGELHRFTPALLNALGFRIGEIEVLHHPREFGQSKYGAKRFIKGILDLLTVKFVTQYSARPLHFFALAGLPILLLGSAIIFYLSVLWLMGLGPIGDRPLLLIGILMVVTGTQLVGVGLLAELIQSNSINEDDKYVVRRTVGF